MISGPNFGGIHEEADSRQFAFCYAFAGIAGVRQGSRGDYAARHKPRGKHSAPDREPNYCPGLDR